MHSFEVHSNESVCRKSGGLGLEQVIRPFLVLNSWYCFWSVFYCGYWCGWVILFAYRVVSSEWFSYTSQFFVGLCFSWELEKNALIWYKFYVLRTSYSKKCKSYYWFLTLVENPSTASCRLIVTIMVCQVHHNWKRRVLMYTELNYLWIRHLHLRLWWMCDTTIGTTFPQITGDSIFLCSL